MDGEERVEPGGIGPAGVAGLVGGVVGMYASTGSRKGDGGPLKFDKFDAVLGRLVSVDDDNAELKGEGLSGLSVKGTNGRPEEFAVFLETGRGQQGSSAGKKGGRGEGRQGVIKVQGGRVKDQGDRRQGRRS